MYKYVLHNAFVIVQHSAMYNTVQCITQYSVQMLLPHVLLHAKRVYQQLRSLTRIYSSGGFGWNFWCILSKSWILDVIKTETFLYHLVFYVLYVVYCILIWWCITGHGSGGHHYGGDVHERAHRSITDLRYPSNYPQILN